MKSAGELRIIFDSHLDQVLSQGFWKEPLFEPMNYILRLKAKRVRPVLLLLAYQSVSGEDSLKALNTAASVELFHNFTLMHDDIMDRAEVRRGMPSVHKKWNPETAILAGDGMFALSMDFLIRDFPGFASSLVKEFSSMAVGVCEGQMEDMNLSGNFSASMSDYLEMIRKKTAWLIGSSMAIGAIAAGADEKIAKQYAAWGEASGVAFQIMDDYLDVFGAGEKVGKRVGGDILENKMTWILLRALAKSDGKIESELHHLLNKESDATKKVKGVLSIFEQLEIKKETEAFIAEKFHQADELGKTLSHLPGYSLIFDFFTSLKSRES